MTKEVSVTHLLVEMIEGLRQAEGACSQLIHSHQDFRWSIIRESIELTKEGVSHVATMPTQIIRKA